MPDYPESPEGVAYALTRDVVRAETEQPIEQLTDKTKPSLAGNQTVRRYILDTYRECLSAAKGEEIPHDGNGKRRRRA